MTEAPLPVDAWAPGSGISYAVVYGAGTGEEPEFSTGVLVLPDGVESYTVWVKGYVAGEADEADSAAGFRNVPYTPGTELLLEAGGPGQSSIEGGAGGPADGDTGEGIAGGGAAWISERDGDVIAVAGGRAGSGYEPGGIAHPAPHTNPVTTWGGGGSPQAGGAGSVSFAGGGGGGWGTSPAAGGVGLYDPGENGGSYYPPSEDVGGSPSPTWDALDLPYPWAGPPVGGVFVWWFNPAATGSGWTVEATDF